MMPAALRRADDQRVRGGLLGRGGQFPGRAATPGGDAHVDAGPVADLVELGEQPALGLRPVPYRADHLAGEGLTVDARGTYVDDQQWPAEAARQPGGIGQ